MHKLKVLDGFDVTNKDDHHYFLTVTKNMAVETLVRNLKQVADRMPKIKDGSRVIS